MAAWETATPSWSSSWKRTRAVAAASGTSCARCRRRSCRVTWIWPPACTRTAGSTSPSSSSPPSCRCRLPPATTRRGDLSRAARNFDAAGDGDQALALYEQIGDQESRADCLLRSGRAFEAADLYVELGNVRGEVDALRKVPETDPLRVDAVKRLAAILARRNRLAEATQLAADALRENDAAKKDLGLHELLVDLLVRQGLHDQAERVRTRMQRIAARERVGAAVAPPPSASSGPAPAAPEDYGFLKAIPLFGKLPLQDMKDLYRLSAEVTYKPGAIVVEEGVDAPGLI